MSEDAYRLVDAGSQGWLVSSERNAGGETLYRPSYGERRGLTAQPRSWIEQNRGPLRVVQPPTDDEVEQLRHLLAACGTKAVATLAAALEVVFHNERERLGGLNSRDSYELAKMALMAGREGSWESVELMNVVLVGNGFNLMRKGLGSNPTVERMREAGPVRRVDRENRDLMATVLAGWTLRVDSGRYVEVAETLASIVSQFADEQYGAEGWRRIADQYLQPDAKMFSPDMIPLYRLFYSVSEHFDPDAPTSPEERALLAGLKAQRPAIVQKPPSQTDE